MGTNVINLEKFKKGAAAAFAKVSDYGSLGDGIGSSYGVIHYRGKVWSLQYRGQTHIFRRPDDGTAAASIKLVILRDPGRKAKQYYPEWKEGGERKPPVCSSLDGVVPQPDSLDIQAESCALCPRNEGKRDATGRWKKECRDLKRLAIMLHPESSAPLFGGQALLEPVYMPIPAGSLSALAEMGREMEDMGYPYFSYVVQAKFVEEESFPRMTFSAVEPLEGEEAEWVSKALDLPELKRITGEDSHRTGVRQIAATAPPKQVGFATATPVQIKVAPEPDAPRIQTTAFSDAKPVTIDHAPVSAPVADEEIPPSDKNLDATIAQMVNAVKGNG